MDTLDGAKLDAHIEREEADGEREAVSEYRAKHSETNAGRVAGPWGVGREDVYAQVSPSGGGDLICSAPVGWEASMRHWPANACLIAAAPDFYDACLGPDPNNSRLSLLETLLEDLRAANYPASTVDPVGEGVVLSELEAFCVDLKAALAKAEGHVRQDARSDGGPRARYGLVRPRPARAEYLAPGAVRLRGGLAEGERGGVR